MKKLFFTIFSFFLITPVLAQGDLGLGAAASEAGLQKKTVASLPTDIGSLVGYILSLVGILFFILTIYGGVLWMTSRGNDEQQGKAKKVITGALIGLLIVFASYAIPNYVLGLL